MSLYHRGIFHQMAQMAQSRRRQFFEFKKGENDMSRTHRKSPPNVSEDEKVEYERDHKVSSLETHEGEVHTEYGKKFAKKMKHHKDRIDGKREVDNQKKDYENNQENSQESE